MTRWMGLLALTLGCSSSSAGDFAGSYHGQNMSLSATVTPSGAAGAVLTDGPVTLLITQRDDDGIDPRVDMDIKLVGNNTDCSLVAIRTDNTASIGNYRTQACSYTVSDRSSVYMMQVTSGTAALAGKQLTVNLSG